MSNKQTTLADWRSEGFDQQQGANFAQDVHAITPLALFVRSLPRWVEENDTGVKIVIECKPGMEGAAIAMAFDRDKLPVAAAQQLIEQMAKTARLMELESHIELLRGVSTNYELINKLVEEAEQLAEFLNG